MTKQLNKFRLDKKLIFDQMKDFCRSSRGVSTLLMLLSVLEPYLLISIDP